VKIFPNKMTARSINRTRQEQKNRGKIERKKRLESVFSARWTQPEGGGMKHGGVDSKKKKIKRETIMKKTKTMKEEKDLSVGITTGKQ